MIDSKIVKEHKELVNSVTQVRVDVTKKYGKGTNLCGKCIIASDMIVDKLKKLGYKAKAVEGYCWYDTNLGGLSSAPYDEHTWVEVYGIPELRGSILFIDVTGDQFNTYICEKNDGIMIGKTPYCYNKRKPNEKEMLELGWY